MPTRELRITTGSRLHFGPLSYRPQRGRHFGGVGLMLESPANQLVVSSRQQDRVIAPDGAHLPSLVDRIRQQQPTWSRPLEVRLEAMAPRHCGFGTGTQIGLALCDAMARLHGEILPVETLAEICGRGERSAIGMHGYAHGGFLVDAGHRPGEALGELAVQLNFPDTWRVLTIIPQDVSGIHGESELQVFSQLESMPERLSDRLCRLTLTEILPAIHKGHFSDFAAALQEYGQCVGEFFAACQEGVYASPAMRALAEERHLWDIPCLVQSSWGPVAAVVVESTENATELRTRLQSSGAGENCEIAIHSAMNCGRMLAPRDQLAAGHVLEANS